MAYDPPTRAVLKDSIRRALRDDGTVFSTDLLDDFINESMADLSVVRPVETTITVPFDPTQITGLDPADYANFIHVWMVEARAAGSGYQTRIVIPFGQPGEYIERNGWDFYDETVVFSQWWFARLNELVDTTGAVTIFLWGYRNHHWPLDDASVMDLQDSVDHRLVMRHIKALGFQSLESDRSLYQQWLAATNNTDVSPTQLQGMRAQAEQSYERLRKQVQRPKRIPVTGIQYVS
jgi:hypothetical protein